MTLAFQTSLRESMPTSRRKPCLRAGDAIPGDADHNQHRLAHDDTGFAYLLVAGIEDEVGEWLQKRTFGKRLQALVQPLVDGRDRRGREVMAAQLFPDRLDLARRNTLHIHLPSVATKARSERW